MSTTPTLEELNHAYILLLRQITSHQIPNSDPIVTQLLANPTPPQAYQLLTQKRPKSKEKETNPITTNSSPLLLKGYSRANDEKKALTHYKTETIGQSEVKSPKKKRQKDNLKQIMGNIGNIFRNNQKKVERYEEMSQGTSTTKLPF